MISHVRSLRPFIGSKDYELSRYFYRDLDFYEVDLGDMCYYQVSEQVGFYLQRYYQKEWVNNTMLFLEVEQLDEYLETLRAKQLTDRYQGVRLSEIETYDWGRELFLHDPSGVLWHIGEFNIQ